jgi:hypothetical protein
MLLLGNFSFMGEVWGLNSTQCNTTCKAYYDVLLVKHAQHEKLCNTIQCKTIQDVKGQAKKGG